VSIGRDIKTRSLLFLKKKKQKDFVGLPGGGERRAVAINRPRGKPTKVLWFFLSRKNNAFSPW
jgi:hypothetical protein